ncbi:MAG: hypothetical protein GY888_32545, partial [Planctomycetaceae bacterium]|nr:hypothetical protein [Planctomycetaceae bacterium]
HVDGLSLSPSDKRGAALSPALRGIIRTRKLQLRWLDPNAPNGAWVDEVQLNAQGTAYYGKNQTGTVIRGTKVRD